MIIHEIKEKSGKFYLITSEFESCGSAEDCTGAQREDLRLLLIVLSYIFMKGGKVIEQTLFGILQRLHIDGDYHAHFGYFRKKITETFVKQQYLKREKIEMEAGNTEER